MEQKFEYIWKFLRENNCDEADSITSTMRCTICKRVMVNAQISGCGCRFCFECVSHYAKGNGKFCPGNSNACCNNTLMVINETVCSDEAMNQEISRLLMKCPRDGCDFFDELGNMEEHDRLCEKRAIKCPYCDIGCQEWHVINGKIDGHLSAENEKHVSLLMDCIGRLQNDIRSMKNDIVCLTLDGREHQRMAEQYVGKIANLDREVRALKDENVSMRDQIATLQATIDINQIENKVMTLSMEQQILEFRDRQQKQKEEIEKFRQKSVMHDRKLDGLELQVGHEKEIRQSTVDEMREKQVRYDEVAMRVHENWINVENRQRGEVVWHIDDFSARRQAARGNTENQVIYSSPFFLPEQGYMMRLSLWPGGDDLFITWRLMRGPFDEYLSWPFKGAVTLSVIDQQSRVDHNSITIPHDQYPNSDGRNYGFFNLIKLISQEELSGNPAMCKDDRIFIRCVVKSIK